MAQMDRVTAGHGQGGNPFESLPNKIQGRTNSMLYGMQQAKMQGAQHEHERGMQMRDHAHAERMQGATHDQELMMAVTHHVLGKDMHNHVVKSAEPGTAVSLKYNNLETNITKKNKTPRTPKKSSGGSAYALPPIGWPEKPQTQGVNLGSNIPTTPGEWKGGWMEHNPVTGKAQTKPGYKEFKSKKQHFAEGIASQEAAQVGHHFTMKPGIKIPNYAKKAMQKKQNPKRK